MMKRKITNFVLLLAFGCATLFSFGCGGGGGNGTPDPNRGFFVSVTAAGIPTVARVQGNVTGGTGNMGSLNQLDITTFGAGFTQIPNTKVPGTWRMTYGPSVTVSSLCLTFVTVGRNVSLGSMETLPCPPRFFSFTASPNMIDALTPPATVSFTGEGTSTLYGTPMLEYYNEFGNVAASTTANQLLYDSFGVVEGVSVNVPDLTNAYDGEYTVAVHN